MDRRTLRWSVLGLVAASSLAGASAWAKPRFFSRTGQNAKATQPAAEQAPIQWLYDLKTAQRFSAATGRPMLIVFGAPWCTYCKKLEREVLGHPTLSNYINSAFIPVHLDFENERDKRIAQVLEVKSLPTSVILSPGADLLGTVEGYVKTNEFAQVLQQSLEFQRTLKAERSVALRGR